MKKLSFFLIAVGLLIGINDLSRDIFNITMLSIVVIMCSAGLAIMVTKHNQEKNNEKKWQSIHDRLSAVNE